MGRQLHGCHGHEPLIQGVDVGPIPGMENLESVGVGVNTGLGILGASVPEKYRRGYDHPSDKVKFCLKSLALSPPAGIILSKHFRRVGFSGSAEVSELMHPDPDQLVSAVELGLVNKCLKILLGSSGTSHKRRYLEPSSLHNGNEAD